MATASAAPAASMAVPLSASHGQLRTLPGAKDLRVACTTCTFLNASEAEKCEMCGAKMVPTAYEVQANGTWKCGSCAALNGKGVKECCECRLPFYARVTSAAPSQILCPRCGFLNDGGNVTCVQCDTTIRSTLEKLSTDLRDSTNFLARDMGVNVHVKCPGCLLVCSVPPATACLRCGACHTYFASPSVGEATNFHVTRLASSISSSFMGFFGQKQSPPPAADPARDAPIGRLIALGKDVVKSPRRRPATSSGSEATLMAAEHMAASADSLEEKAVLPDLLAEADRPSSSGATSTPSADATGSEETEALAGFCPSPPPSPSPSLVRVPPAGSASSSSTGRSAKAEVGRSSDKLSRSTKLKPLDPLPPMARSLPVREALPAPPQDLIEVEGEIVEL